MPIHRLIKNSAFDPEHIAALVEAYETALRELTLAKGESSVSSEGIAATVIQIAQNGVREVESLVDQTIARLHR